MPLKLDQHNRLPLSARKPGKCLLDDSPLVSGLLPLVSGLLFDLRSGFWKGFRQDVDHCFMT
jgi:hypothetical protein